MNETSRRQQILSDLQDAVVEFEQESMRDTVQRALQEGIDAHDAIVNGLVAGMERVGELCSTNEYFLPEVLQASDTFNIGLRALRPHLRTNPRRGATGRAVVGTIEGDIHDLGKNLLAVMLEAAGFQVFDLGVDVPPRRFVAESIRTAADLVCISATITTVRQQIAEAIDRLRLDNRTVGVLIGGRAVRHEDVENWGADGYAPDAIGAVEEALRITRSPGNPP